MIEVTVTNNPAQTVVVESPGSPNIILVESASSENTVEINTVAAPAKTVLFRNDGTYIQWKVGEGNWTNLVLLDDITGPPGSGGGGSAQKLSTIKSASIAASLLDASKVVKLNGAANPVDYTIDPVTSDGYLRDIICIDATFRVRVLPLTGTINNQSEIEFGAMDAVVVWSDGTNLFLLK